MLILHARGKDARFQDRKFQHGVTAQILSALVGKLPVAVRLRLRDFPIGRKFRHRNSIVSHFTIKAGLRKIKQLPVRRNDATPLGRNLHHHAAIPHPFTLVHRQRQGQARTRTGRRVRLPGINGFQL